MGCLKLTYYGENEPLLKCVWNKKEPGKPVQWFYTLDPLAEKYNFQSPYVYAANNPIMFVDINGMEPGDPNDFASTLGYETAWAVRKGIQGTISITVTAISAVNSLVYKLQGDVKYNLGLESVPGAWGQLARLKWDRPDGTNTWNAQLVPLSQERDVKEAMQTVVDDALDAVSITDINPIPTNPVELLKSTSLYGLNKGNKSMKNQSSSTTTNSTSNTSTTSTYTVQKGDNLTKIAKSYNTTVSQIVNQNNIEDVNKIQVGQQLQMTQ